MEVTTMLYTFHEVKKTEKFFKQGEFPVKIRLSHSGDTKYIPLGYSSSVENWDEFNNLPRPSHAHYKELFKIIEKYLEDISFQIKVAEKAGQYLSCIELKRKVMHTDSNLPELSNQLRVLEYFDKVINELEEAGNPGYADVFESTRSTVSKLLNNGVHIPVGEREKEKDKSFVDFTKADHQKYERQISKPGATESTISFYLRNYFRIWNLAIKDGYCTRKDHHPAQFIKFQPYKKIRTKKRSINQDYLHDIFSLKFATGSRPERSQKLLQFIYYARGINFGDMCKLKHENIANGTIHYKRSKNHREYDYTLHPKALEVIAFFKNHPEQSDTGYIFPFLNATHNTARRIDTRIESALKDFNEDLKDMAVSVGWERKFTSYSLRHGFATHLRNNGVDILYIKDALGHEDETQTNVYLEDLDDKIVSDKINKGLDFKKKQPPKKRRGKSL